MNEEQLREIESRYMDGGLTIAEYQRMPISNISRMRCDIKRLYKEVRRLQSERDAAVEALRGIESCLICMPGGAGCSAYGGDACYRTSCGPCAENEGV